MKVYERKIILFLLRNFFDDLKIIYRLLKIVYEVRQFFENVSNNKTVMF
jgi:hypothetical protein